MTKVEPRQQRRQHRVRGRRNGTQPQRRAGAQAQRRQGFGHVLQLAHDAARRIGQRLTGRRGPQAARVALEQARIEHPLQLGQRLRGRRLADIQLLRRPHHRAAVAQRQQQLQLAQARVAHQTGQ